MSCSCDITSTHRSAHLAKKFATAFIGQKFQQHLLFFFSCRLLCILQLLQKGGRKPRLLQWLCFLRLHWEGLGCSLQYRWRKILSQTSSRGQLSLSLQTACGAALQITAWNLSVFVEIIPAFQRIKLNPDGSCEPVYRLVPWTILSPPPRGEKTVALD